MSTYPGVTHLDCGRIVFDKETDTVPCRLGRARRSQIYLDVFVERGFFGPFIPDHII